MRVPISWLKKYVSICLPPKDLAHRLTMAGIEVDSLEQIGINWERDKITVGHVVKIDKHPNADRLKLPTVDIGNGEVMTVVCGAPNLTEGQKVAFAKEGATLINPRSAKLETLKPAQIRGVTSLGMICSASELGLNEDHEGILVLDEHAPVGAPLVDHLGDTILHISVTPNRPDCLSILGIAREVAAFTGGKVVEPNLSYPEEGDPIETQVKVEIANPDLCYRYTASLINGIRIGPSPKWMQDALVKAGQRPINNVVDITNYTMLEYGQPLHAFDLDAVKGNTVVVRVARSGEILASLDGERRSLNPPMLTISDVDNAVGLAGVIGGSNSEMHEGSKSVLLESANFDPANTRRTAAALRLSTEASYRFERGIRADLAPIALKRAAQLILQIAGGKASQGIIDLYPRKKDPPVLRISPLRIKQVLGVDFDMAEVEKALNSLGFHRDRSKGKSPTDQESNDLWMKVPYWRSDIAIEDDLVEEVARIIGYDAIPDTALSTPIPQPRPQPIRLLKENLRDLLASTGMQEIITYPLTNQDVLNKVGAPSTTTRPLKIANPMSSELDTLRTSLRGGVLNTLSSNRRMSHDEGIRIFEIGHVYLPNEKLKERKLPEEREMLSGILSGPRSPVSWLAKQETMNFYDAKGVLESIFHQLGLLVEYEPSRDPILHPGKTASLVCNSSIVGIVGEIRPNVLEDFDIENGSATLFELDLKSLLRTIKTVERSYLSISKFPESYRDLTLTVNADVASSSITTAMEKHDLVVKASLFDLYSGPATPDAKKSVTCRVVFQSPTGTLTAKQVDIAQKKILGQLQQQMGAELRVQ